MQKNNTPFTFFFLFFIPLLFAATPSAASDISVEIAVERQQVSVGEPISMQIRVSGADSAEEPDLSKLTSFHIQPKGGQGTSSTQVTNVNGQWQRVTHLGYIFTYTISAKEAGRLSIPPVSVTVEGKTYSTKPLTIVAEKPEETDDFKLRIFLSSKKIFVGEPITMTTTWFVGKDVRNFDFQLPILDDPRFELIPQKKEGSSPQDEIQIQAGTTSLIGVKGRGELNGKDFLTVTFHHLLIAKEPGTFTIPQATVACQVLSGYRESRRGSPFRGFGSFDDFFSNGREAVYRTLVIPANQPQLNVLPLPEENRPADFSGLVGPYSISAEAKPTEVNVGDPITLTLSIAGPFVQQAKLPDLLPYLAETAFKIPEETAAGEVEGKKKSFTLTIRAKDKDIKEIPPVSLVYFDPESAQYRTATSKAIPLTVHATRVVTAEDAEGAVSGQNQKNRLEEAAKGLAFNYEGEDVLLGTAPQASPASGFFLLLLAGPPLVFMLALAASFYKKRLVRGSGQRQAKKALSTLHREFSNTPLTTAALSTAFKKYLGTRLLKNPATLTFLDLEHPLRSRMVDESILQELNNVLEFFEAWRFGGQDPDNENIGQLKERCLQLARQLESHLS